MRLPPRIGAALVVVLAAIGAAVSLGAESAAASMVAPGSRCPGQQNTKAPEHLQQQAMVCLIDYARRRAGAGGVRSAQALERAAGRKARDVMQCGFSHTACGNPADLYAQRYGYTSGTSGWQWGENLAWGSGRRSTARMVLKAWLASPPHRTTMLRGSFDDIGIGLRRGSFGGRSRAGVWVLELGCRGC